MSCANSGITILSLVIVVFSIWPSLSSLANWINLVAALLIIVLVWTGCNCKWCEMSKPSKPKRR